ncbi:hypothetical protein ACEPAI_3271 [Sanghuangporus weigelae]
MTTISAYTSYTLTATEKAAVLGLADKVPVNDDAPLWSIDRTKTASVHGVNFTQGGNRYLIKNKGFVGTQRLEIHCTAGNVRRVYVWVSSASTNKQLHEELEKLGKNGTLWLDTALCFFQVTLF